MKYQPLDTLAYYDTAPHLKLVNLGDIEVPQVAINCQHYLKNIDTPRPEKYAVSFYTINHLVMMVRSRFTKHEKLPGWAVQVMDKYSEILADQGRRMLNYLMLITTREARHASITAGQKEEWAKIYGQELIDFLKYTHGSGSDEAVQKFLNKPPKMKMSAYYNALEFVFLKAKFGGGYGGKPWANIAKTLASFIDGKTSMEMMIDTAYTLAHNGGPIFNKGMCYGTYTEDIYMVLDVQRSGQMVELVLSGKLGLNYTDSQVRALATAAYEMFPEEFGTEVDWYKVEALGSMHKYPNFKKLQAKQPPKTEKKPAKSFGELLEAAGEATKLEHTFADGTFAEVKLEPFVKELKIIGNQTVQIVERAK